MVPVTPLSSLERFFAPSNSAQNDPGVAVRVGWRGFGVREGPAVDRSRHQCWASSEDNGHTRVIASSGDGVDDYRTPDIAPRRRLIGQNAPGAVREFLRHLDSRLLSPAGGDSTLAQGESPGDHGPNPLRAPGKGRFSVCERTCDRVAHAPIG